MALFDNIMERYDIGRVVGEGSFGTVHVAVHKTTGEKVRFVVGVVVVAIEGRTLSEIE